mmetsp:Transcript_9601/g.43735  ORF Transcript_9601/g.43735 Transcript_9601/m.43735 type:complete len:269 (+) Transcript_9601:75-881(+)
MLNTKYTAKHLLHQSPLTWRKAWTSTGASAAAFSAAALGRPGRLTTRHLSLIPATPRLSIACGSCANADAVIACAIPGTSLCSTDAVASGVTSLGAHPVPPVVNTRLHPVAVISLILDAICDRSSGTMCRCVDSTCRADGFPESFAMAVMACKTDGPLSSAYSPENARSLTVRMPSRMATGPRICDATGPVRCPDAAVPGGAHSSAGVQHTSERTVGDCLGKGAAPAGRGAGGARRSSSCFACRCLSPSNAAICVSVAFAWCFFFQSP